MHRCKRRGSGDDQMLAVKIMKASALSAEDLEALHTEVEVLKKLQHPNVVALLVKGR